jgi:hypothetical protein
VRLVRQYHTSWSLMPARGGSGKGAPYRRWIVQKQTGRAALLKQKVGGGGLLAMLERKARRNEKKQR